ncbi:glutathione S-transferase [Apiospora hydei]|uniref:Glutathione S-transferase n=1 Tax=Apiospora hydei TaxID=1337664 RepID=A0ABR1X1Y9_9PEZI
MIPNPLILHAHTTGPNPIKIAEALEFLEVPYEVKMWDFGDDPQKGVKGAAFLALNENGRVPALEDPNTGVVSWESGACMAYLLRVYDKANKLGPRGSSEQDTVDFDKWNMFLLTTLGPMTGQTNWYRHYNPTKNDDALKRYVEQTERCYSVLEGQLKKTLAESIIPGGVTAVDLQFEPWFAGISLDPYPSVAKWLSNMAGLPEVIKAYKRISEAPKP